MRRFLLLFAVVLLLGSLDRPARGAATPEWVLVDQNEDSRFYYDPHPAGKGKEGVVQVRTRVVYTDEGKADALKILKDKKFAPLFESRYLYELDCLKERSRLLETSHLDQDGIVLKSTNLGAVTNWEEIQPLTRIGQVLEKVCPPPGQK